jgi:hypothetical protein
VTTSSKTPTNTRTFRLIENRTNEYSSTAITIDAFQIPWIKELTKLIASNLRENFDWFGAPQHNEGIKLLDYACGNGMASMVKMPSFLLLFLHFLL